MTTLPPQATLPSFPGEDEAYAALREGLIQSGAKLGPEMVR